MSAGLVLARKPPRAKGRAGCQPQRDRIYGRPKVPRRRRFGSHLLHRGRRGLAGRQTVDLVVHHDIGQVQVAPHCVDKMAQANAIAVAVSAGDDDLQVMVGELYAACDSNSAPMQAVDSVRMKESRQVRRAADARDYHQVFGRDAELACGDLESSKNTKVATARTPIRFNNGFVGFNRKLNHSSHVSLLSSLNKMNSRGRFSSNVATEERRFEALTADTQRTLRMTQRRQKHFTPSRLAAVSPYAVW